MFKKSLSVLGLLVCSAAFAQYSWVDENGHKQYSDQPPPASVPEKNILKAAPLKKPVTANNNTSTAKPASLAERELDFQKKRTEQAEKEKKQAEEQQAAEKKAKNCEELKRYQETLKKGVRIARTNEKGEREIINDTTRARELKTVEERLKNCGNP